MKDTVQIYTNISIIQKVIKSDLKKYFNSIKRQLPVQWFFLKDEIYDDNDTFAILNEVFCLKTPYYKDNERDLIFYGKIFIGLTDDYISILKIELHDLVARVDIETTFSPDEKIRSIYHFAKLFHDSILKSNKSYDKFDYKFEFGGPSDENYFKDDIRDERSLKTYSKHDKKTYFFAKGKQAKIEGKSLIFFTPNNISMSLSLTKKSFKNAKRTFKALLNGRNEKTIKLENKDKSLLYEYFEEITTSIIFAYIAVEAFTNAAIPEDFQYEKLNDKKVKEIWSKENIERWLTTSQKVSEILPIILKTNDIKKEDFWQQFKALEKLRNDIIHQKTIENGTTLNSEMYVDLLNSEVFQKIKSAISVIKFFYDYDNAHPYFPLGLGIARVQIKEVENIYDDFGHFEEIK